jgi:hypothetical protein
VEVLITAVVVAAAFILAWVVGGPRRRPRRFVPHAHRVRGQALVELALVLPILMAVLLGIIGMGLYFTASVQQAATTATIAGWAGANPSGDLGAFAASVTSCATSAVYGPSVVTITVECPTVAGEILPVLPRMISTVSTAFVP